MGHCGSWCWPASPVGASLLAKNQRTPRSSGMGALSLAIFASKLAPTEGPVALRPWRGPAGTGSAAVLDDQWRPCPCRWPMRCRRCPGAPS
ncbi:hypothetical protein FHP26_08975 [Pseudomonas orientalis]|nr:hypothetical protein [Pseudomonas orientalis]